MDQQKQILIITDDNAAIGQISADIAAIIGTYPGCRAAVIRAEQFTGVELLPACAFFIGCGKKSPASFTYLEDMLGHINLAGRPCGVFSPDSGAAKYLSTLLGPSEAAMGKPLLAKGGAVDREKLQTWIQGIIGTAH